jgi:mRNA interferase RelE/StbE
MQVEASKRFFKDIQVLETETYQAVLNIIELAENATSVRELPNIKKLTGFKNAYRVRLGKYRIALLTIENDTVSFERCLPRNKIYKVFP